MVQDSADNSNRTTSNSKDEPLNGKTICLTGTLSKVRRNLANLIERNGGKVSSSVTDETSFLVASEDAYRHKTRKVAAAKEKDVPIVNEDYLHECIEKGSDDVKVKDFELVNTLENDNESEKPRKKRKVDEGYESKASVLSDKDDNSYDVRIINTEDNHNKFYRMQLIKDHDKYVLYGRYGKIDGLERKFRKEYDTMEDAVEEFEDKFQNKTKNTWSQYLKGEFSAHKGSYKLDDNFK
jgi:predicted DNA-binding WGR domain protein